MLPSMPILFTRESQDAFGNKILPSTSFFNQNTVAKTSENPTIFQPSPQSTPKIPLEPQPSTSKSTGLLQNVVLFDPQPSTSKFSDPQPSTSKCSAPPQKSKKCNSNQKKKEVNVPSEIDYKSAINTAIARNYYKKVQSKFASDQSVPNKFIQFRDILKSFSRNTETAADLYRKIEKVLDGEHNDLLEEFLLFLNPDEAAEVGRFMDHFTIVQMSDFIQTLQITLSRKPTVLRKVIRAINTCVGSGCSEELKKKVLPHLRSSPQLTAMFKSLFPEERPPDSLYEEGFTCVNEETIDKDYDVLELEVEPAKKRPADKNTLDTVYLHRVFLQHGRILKPAIVTFPFSKEPYRVHARRLAPAHCRLSPSESDEERVSPKRNHKSTPKNPPKRTKTKKQTKSPIKSMKDVNDNTKHKDCIANSPRVKKSQSNTKNKSKKEPEIKEPVAQKRDKKDKNEAPKAKQARIEGLESKKIDIKTEIRVTESKSKLDAKVVDAKKSDNKVIDVKSKSNGKIADKKSDIKIIETKSKLVGKNLESKTKELKSTDNKPKPEVIFVEAKKVEDKTPESKSKTVIKSVDSKKADINVTDSIKIDALDTEANSVNVNTNVVDSNTSKSKITETKPQVVTEVKSNSWTRDEDKTMLQVIKCDASSEVFVKIRDLLPHRTVNEIQERFCHVMNLLQRMAVGEVT